MRRAWEWLGLWLAVVGAEEETGEWEPVSCSQGYGAWAVRSRSALVSGPAECGCCWRQWEEGARRHRRLFYSCLPGPCPQSLLDRCVCQPGATAAYDADCSFRPQRGAQRHGFCLCHHRHDCAKLAASAASTSVPYPHLLLLNGLLLLLSLT